jgi:hypothetical protein
MKRITVHVCRDGQLRDLSPKTKMLMDTIEEIVGQYKNFDLHFEYHLHRSMMPFSADISIIVAKGVVAFAFPDVDLPYTFGYSAVKILEDQIFQIYRKARV